MDSVRTDRYRLTPYEGSMLGTAISYGNDQDASADPNSHAAV